MLPNTDIVLDTGITFTRGLIWGEGWVLDCRNPDREFTLRTYRKPQLESVYKKIRSILRDICTGTTVPTIVQTSARETKSLFGPTFVKLRSGIAVFLEWHPGIVLKASEIAFERYAEPL